MGLSGELANKHESAFFFLVAMSRCEDKVTQYSIHTHRVLIKIADKGSGIPAKIKNRRFDLFFRTKQPGKGTGLGLTVSYQIISQHQGRIEVNSAPGQGTEFMINLPKKRSD